MKRVNIIETLRVREKIKTIFLIHFLSIGMIVVCIVQAWIDKNNAENSFYHSLENE